MHLGCKMSQLSRWDLCVCRAYGSFSPKLHGWCAFDSLHHLLMCFCLPESQAQSKQKVGETGQIHERLKETIQSSLMKTHPTCLFPDTKCN